MKTIVFTPFSISLLILFGLTGVTAINGLLINSNGGGSLGGSIALVFAITFLGVFYIQQKIVKHYKKPKEVWIVEILILVLLISIIIIMDWEFSVG